MHAVIALLLSLVCLAANAEDWPQWRGPNSLGHSASKDLPVTWNAETGENIRWKSPLPKTDTSQSSPVIANGKVFVITSLNTPEHHVTCYALADGKQLWDVVVPPGPWKLTDLRGGYTCATPAADEERVYALFGSSVLVALNAVDGKEVWRQALEPRDFDVAISSSPIFYKDTLILLCDQNNKKSFMVAFDRKSGSEKWRVQRPTNGFNHSTPSLGEVNGKPMLFVSASNALQGVNPENGEILWTCKSKGDVSTPAFGKGLVYTDEGRGGPGICVDPTGKGDVTTTNIKWSMKTGTNGYNSPIIVGDYLYRISVVLRCFKVTDGTEVWSQRLGGDFAPSPIATADGRLYYVSSGKSWVLKAGDKYELLGQSDLAENSSASPAMSGDCLILKGSKTLFCIGKK